MSQSDAWAEHFMAKGDEFCFAAHIAVLSTRAFSRNGGHTVTPTDGVQSAVVITSALCVTGTDSCARTQTSPHDITQPRPLAAMCLCAVRNMCQGWEEEEPELILLATLAVLLKPQIARLQMMGKKS